MGGVWQVSGAGPSEGCSERGKWRCRDGDEKLDSDLKPIPFSNVEWGEQVGVLMGRGPSGGSSGEGAGVQMEDVLTGVGEKGEGEKEMKSVGEECVSTGKIVGRV